MKRPWLGIGIIVLIGLGAFFFIQPYKEPREIHMHAGFQVYVDRKLQDFSQSKYMSIKPCEEGEHGKLSKEEIQLEKAHLHDNVGDVAHIEREGAMWSDLFKNIGYSFPQSKPLDAFINGQRVTNFFTRVIGPYESAVILVGKNELGLLKRAVSKERIKKVEQTSVECGDV